MKTLGNPSQIEPRDAVLNRAKATSSRTKNAARRRHSPLKVADAYLLRQVIGATLRGLLWFAGLLFVTTLIAGIRRLVDGTLNAAGLWHLVLSDIPRIFVFTLPMSLLFGTVQTFAELSSKGEATALQVGGMSVGRMMRAPLLWGALVGFVVFVLQERFVPQTQQTKQSIIAQSAVKSAPDKSDLRISDSGAMNAKGALKRLILVRKLSFKNGVMQQPRIQFFNDEQRIVRQIDAPRALWNATSGKWKIAGAVITDISADGSKVKIAPPRDIEYSMPSPGELGLRTMTLAQHLNNGDLEMASISDLRTHRAELQKTLLRQDESSQITTRRLVDCMTYGIHDKIATGFVCLFFVMIGAPLALRPQRSGGGFAMGISLVVLMSYYILWTCAQNLGRGGEVNPVVFGYLPLVVTATTGLVLFWKKAR